jgi:hypothetical protein
VYREKATGKPVYVGSAFDVAKRDEEHCEGNVPFDRELRRRGRDAFALEIVEAFRIEDVGETWRLSASRENHWMEVLGTFRTEGCFNFKRATAIYDSKEAWDAWLAANSAAQKIAAPIVNARPGFLARRNASIKRSRTPEVIAKIVATLAEVNARPETRARRSAGAKAAMSKPEVLANVSAGVRAACSSPEFLKKRGEAIRIGRAKNPSLFLESTRRAQKERSERHRKEQLEIAEQLAAEHGGTLPSKSWLRKNGYRSIAWLLTNASEFKHLPFEAYKPSEETRRKLRETSRGRKLPPRSEDTIRKMREAQLGHKRSEESRRNQSKSCRAKRLGFLPFPLKWQEHFAAQMGVTL